MLANSSFMNLDSSRVDCENFGVITKRVIQQWTSSFGFTHLKGLWECMVVWIENPSPPGPCVWQKKSNHWSYTKPKKSYPQLHHKKIHVKPQMSAGSYTSTNQHLFIPFNIFSSSFQKTQGSLTDQRQEVCVYGLYGNNTERWPLKDLRQNTPIDPWPFLGETLKSTDTNFQSLHREFPAQAHGIEKKTTSKWDSKSKTNKHLNQLQKFSLTWKFFP